jgi:hypothetical protein
LGGFEDGRLLTIGKKGEKMKMPSARNWQRPLGVVLAIVALTVTGCIGTIHGGGVVALFDVNTGLGEGVPTDANVAVSVICNDNRNEVRSIIHWTDNANGANFTALLPWTPISEVLGLGIDTCEEAAAIVSAEGASFSVGIINSRGQESGTAAIGVSVPGAVPADCGDLQGVVIQATGSVDVLPGGAYFAEGCLDRGKISFQNP